MALNIKNERVVHLVREAARASGKSQTETIEEALRLMLQKYEADPETADIEARVTRIRAAAKDARAAWDRLPPEERFTVADLYDPQTGLPR